ncbi:MAG: hypothetical protein K2N27_07005 [Ruminococcus sp.]|nr:hypothetical protein [Ruminococcus sp.]
MKKILATLSAVALMTATTSAFTANADYIPTVYFTPQAETDSEGTLIISREELAKGLTVTTDVFIDDTSKTCWSVDPKWKCASKFIKLDNVIDPQVPYIPYAYAEEKDGELKRIRHSTACGKDEELNTMFFVCDLGTLYTDNSPLTPYGDNTNDYALTSFDMIFNKNIPYGEYDVYFLTQSEDYTDQRYSTVSMRTGDESVTSIPNVKNLHIKITGANKGDINNDGFIDAKDATIALDAFSAVSTGEDSGLNDDEFFAGDVNSDDIIDSNDASAILGYYSYLSTSEGELSIEDYMNQQ